MLREHVALQSEVIRFICLEGSPCCEVPHLQPFRPQLFGGSAGITVNACFSRFDSVSPESMQLETACVPWRMA